MSVKRTPIEPLSRPAWARVEAGLFARLERGEHLVAEVASAPLRRRRQVWVVAAAFAAAAAVVLSLRLAPSSESAPVARQVEAAAPAVVKHEARIVSRDAPTETTLGEAQLVLAAHSAVNVAGSDAEGWMVRLDAGRVDCTVAPRQGRPPFVVQAGATLVTVVGTGFSVERDGAAARVSVVHGRVQVDSGASHLLLGPGESWPSGEGVAEPRARVEAQDTSTSSEPRGTSPSLVTSRAQRRQFDRAARLESKDPAAALAIYQKLARGKGPWAENALYAQARLEVELGRPRRAGPLLRQYLERHPRGLNVADVRKLLDSMQAER